MGLPGLWKSLSYRNSKDVKAKRQHLRNNFRCGRKAQKNNESGQVPHVNDAPTSGNYEAPTNASDQNIEGPSTPDNENIPLGPSTASRNISAIPKKKI
ncbi:hypothetical protein HHI36_000958 [Cryptolaemus montrouzieri]|uniref:Uncharacterized protein n=1 Tax=Cryptolaemus montrouzieri TaxID=559131 RepID=A0ABD2P6V0_9CUCU